MSHVYYLAIYTLVHKNQNQWQNKKVQPGNLSSFHNFMKIEVEFLITYNYINILVIIEFKHFELWVVKIFKLLIKIWIKIKWM